MQGAKVSPRTGAKKARICGGVRSGVGLPSFKTGESDVRNLHVKLAALVVAITAASTAACIKSDVTETWYVNATGAVHWVIHEQNVRSDAQSPIDRQNEEGEYFLKVQ